MKFLKSWHRLNESVGIDRDVMDVIIDSMDDLDFIEIDAPSQYADLGNGEFWWVWPPLDDKVLNEQHDRVLIYKSNDKGVGGIKTRMKRPLRKLEERIKFMGFVCNIYARTDQEDLIVYQIDIYRERIALTSIYHSKVDYQFIDSRGNQFKVEFRPNRSNHSNWILNYYVKDGENWSVQKLVNGNSYEIIQLVLKDVLNLFANEPHVYPRCSSISIQGLSKENERDFVSQRTKAYVRFLSRNPVEGFFMDSPKNPNNIYSNNILLIRK